MTKFTIAIALCVLVAVVSAMPYDNGHGDHNSFGRGHGSQGHQRTQSIGGSGSGYPSQQGGRYNQPGHQGGNLGQDGHGQYHQGGNLGHQGGNLGQDGHGQYHQGGNLGHGGRGQQHHALGQGGHGQQHHGYQTHGH